MGRRGGEFLLALLTQGEGAKAGEVGFDGGLDKVGDEGGLHDDGEEGIDVVVYGHGHGGGSGVVFEGGEGDMACMVETGDGAPADGERGSGLVGGPPGECDAVPGEGPVRVEGVFGVAFDGLESSGPGGHLGEIGEESVAEGRGSLNGEGDGDAHHFGGGGFAVRG